MSDEKIPPPGNDPVAPVAEGEPQPSFFDKATICLQVLYMLRIPVLLGAAVFLFPAISHFLAPTLLGGLYDLSDKPLFAAFWYSLFVFLFAWAVMTSIKINVNYGPRRMGLMDDAARIWFRDRRVEAEKKLYIFWLVTGLAAFSLSGLFWVKCGVMSSGIRLPLFGGMILGFLLAFGLLYVADIINSSFYKPVGIKFMKLRLFPYDTKRLIKLREKSLDEIWVVQILRWLFPTKENSLTAWLVDLQKRFFKWFMGHDVLSRGYYAIPDKRPATPTGISGHVTALTMAIVFGIVYLAFGYGDRVLTVFGAGSNSISFQNLFGVPAIVYIPILGTVVCWILSALSFFLDSYRIPLLAPILAWLLLMSPLQEHYYPVKEIPPKPATLFGNPAGNAADKDDFIIVVAADGGGIQAAAWTARVLTGIEEKCQEELKISCKDKIKLISGVSGGSVGTMYYVDGLKPGALSPQELSDIRQRAASSSLRSVAWGLAYPDFIKSFIPYGTHDRGRELERDWGRNLRVQGSPDEPDISRLDLPLSAWKQGVSEGWRPDVIFNTTMVETGGRIMISTSDLLNGQRPITAGQPRVSHTFEDIYPKREISVASAARLSASFPYVTPVAQGDFGGEKYRGYETAHLADGGYFDNYGVVSMIEWLDLRLRQPDRPKKVIVVQIRCGDIAGAQQKNAKPDDTGIMSIDESSQGGFYQIAAPLLTLYNVRTAGQRERADKELLKFRDSWDKKPGDERVMIREVTFNFSEGVRNPEPPPLSWHLTPKEKRDIEDSWSLATEKARAWGGFRDIVDQFQSGN